MPELPEVEIFTRVVRDHCRGRTIERVAVTDPLILEGVAPAALERRLAGAPIRAAERYGKHLLILFSRAGALAMHFGTNGSLEPVSPAAAAPRYTRLQLHFAGGGGLAYVNPRRLGRVSLCDSPAAFAAANRLGPDALDPTLDLPRFAALLAKSRRDLKALLMDQQRLAGIGNIYSDEILFQARLHPGAVASALGGEEGARLFHAMRETLATAIRCGAGSEQMTERLPKDFLLPHRHPGGRCPRCGTALGVLKRGGRTGYYCPRCQGA
jgi:formamidopyrimidine-DNA glycosylase